MFPSMYPRDADNVNAIRKRQIDTLKAFNDKVITVQENTDYCIEFTTPAGSLCLNVHLPVNFPNEKPILTVNPPVIHPWVTNQRDITNAPGIVNFTIHSDLGRVANAVIREWQTRPPQVLISPNAETTPAPTLPQSEDFPSLSSLPPATLLSLSTNNDRLEEFVTTLPHWKCWDQAVQNKIEQIEQIARENIGKEADIVELKKKVSDVASEAQSVKATFDDKSREYARLSEVYEPSNIRCKLQEAARESDVVAEDIAERFLDGDIDVDQFLLDYVEMRKVSQMRKTKEEKLGKQLMELQKAGY